MLHTHVQYTVHVTVTAQKSVATVHSRNCGDLRSHIQLKQILLLAEVANTILRVYVFDCKVRNHNTIHALDSTRCTSKKDKRHDSKSRDW